MLNRFPPRFKYVVAAAVLVTAACGGSSAESDSTSTTAASTTTTTAPPTTTTTAPTTTTTAPTTTITEPEPTALEKLGYPVSTEWVVETIVAGVDSSTGGLAFDADGNFLQADFASAGAIYRISPDGDIETLVDVGSNLTMTVIGPNGDIWQSSYGSGEVFRISPDGSEVELMAEGILGPTGLVINEDGSFYVQAYDASILHFVDTDGEITEVVRRSGLLGPNGMDRGPDGTLYLTNHRDGGLFSVTPEGEITELHTFPKESSHLVYHEDSLFVTSRGSFVVYRYDLATGDIEVIAGSGEPGDVDGGGGVSTFGRPNAIILGPDGALYINHGVGNANSPLTIRRISRLP